MLAFLHRKKTVSADTGAEIATGVRTAAARQKRVFDRTVMSPDIVVPVRAAPTGPNTPAIFGSKPAED